MSTEPPTSISVHVTSFIWAPRGCGLASIVTAGGYYKAGASLNESLEISNHNISADCLVSAISVTPNDFTILGTDLPLTVDSAGTGIVLVEINLPSYAAPTNVSIALTAEYDS